MLVRCSTLGVTRVGYQSVYKAMKACIVIVKNGHSTYILHMRALLFVLMSITTHTHECIICECNIALSLY